jgi:oligopeptidase B
VWRHTLRRDRRTAGLEEPDERFFVGVGLTRSEEWILIDVHSKVTSEVRVIPARARAAPTLIAAAPAGRRVRVEHDPPATGS